jgi:hypothetical protein
MRTARTGCVVVAATVAVGLFGCAEIKAERNGKDLGQAICDLEGADSVEEADEALADIRGEIEDLTRVVGRPVTEDLSDIEEQLDDLREHVPDNPELADQDVVLIQQNAADIADTLSGSRQAAYDGVVEGLGDCT